MVAIFLFIDDDTRYAASFLKRVNGFSKRVRITHAPPPKLEEISDLFRAHPKMSGLIIDMRLQMLTDAGKVRASYRGSALAQECRTRMTEKKLRPMPIVLLSGRQVIEQTFKTSESGKLDQTSLDLFDKVYVKQEMPGVIHRVEQELFSLVRGYGEIISKSKKEGKDRIYRILGMNNDDQRFLDERIFTRFVITKSYPVHEYARFILRNLIERSGPLVDEQLLAIRLGVNAEESGSQWTTLLSELSARCAYRGPFREAWPRWWWHRVDHWWSRLKNNPGRLISLGARERVQFLRRTLNLNKLSAYQSDIKGQTDRFWNICKESGLPLEPHQGFRILVQNEEVWQDPTYLSEREARKHLRSGKYLFSDQEAQRIKSLNS